VLAGGGCVQCHMDLTAESRPSHIFSDARQNAEVSIVMRSCFLGTCMLCATGLSLACLDVCHMDTCTFVAEEDRNVTELL
jgi:hypothetical protein